MNINEVLFAQNNYKVIIQVIALLLIASAFGYFIAKYYSNLFYLKKTSGIKADKAEMINKMINLKSDKRKLHNNIREKEHKINFLYKELYFATHIDVQLTHKPNYITSQTLISKPIISQTDAAIKYVAQRKCLLNYSNSDIDVLPVKDDLTMISGITSFIEDRLNELDIYSFKQICQFSLHDIKCINEDIECLSGRIERDNWVAQAIELSLTDNQKNDILKRIHDKNTTIDYNRIGFASIADADDLTTISGLGGWVKNKLNALGLFTFKQICNLTEIDISIVTEAIEYYHGRIDRDEWVLQAKELVKIEGGKYELLSRIEDRKARIYYKRLGIVPNYQADNLTRIKGIGLWVEERLNRLDIYTFEQISKLTPTDVDTITELFEVEPNCIDRINWVRQAQGFEKNSCVQF